MNLLNAFNSIKNFLRAPFSEKMSQIFFTNFGYRSYAHYNPAQYFWLARGPYYTFATYYANPRYMRFNFPAYKYENLQEEIHVGFFDYFTLMLPMVIENILLNYCTMVLFFFREIFWEWGMAFRFDGFFEGILASIEFVLRYLIPFTVVLALTLPAYAFNAVIFAARTLVATLLSAVLLPFAVVTHLISRQIYAELEDKASKLEVENLPLNLGQRLGHLFYQYDDYDITELSTSNIVVKLHDCKFLEGKCALKPKNKEALKALFQLKPELSKRYGYFEKQFLGSRADRYEGYILNSLSVKKENNQDFDDLRKWMDARIVGLSEHGSYRYSGVDFSYNAIGTSPKSVSYLDPKAKQPVPVKTVRLDQFRLLLALLPENIKYLDLSHNQLDQLSPHDLNTLLQFVPPHIRAVNLSSNGLFKRYSVVDALGVVNPEALRTFNEKLPPTVNKIYWEDSNCPEGLIQDNPEVVQVEDYLAEHGITEEPLDLILDYTR